MTGTKKMNVRHGIYTLTGIIYITIACTAVSLAIAQEGAGPAENAVVYKEDGRFGGWPANNGIWSWGNEIVVGFTLGYYKKNPSGGHDIDPDRPSADRYARSLDGGRTWTVEVPSYLENDTERALQDPPGRIDFTHPDCAVKLRMNKFYYSLDRCRTWNGPYRMPSFGREALLARTDYIVEGKHRLTAFVAATKGNGREGQPLCIRTVDGGKTWQLVGWIGVRPPVDMYGYAIMPSTVQLEYGDYLTMIRRGGVFESERRWWLEAFLSPDQGKSWYKLEKPFINNGGNPASMIRLKDGRIALTYGWRRPPYGIRAMISQDDGQTWSREIVLRNDGASWDLGYPRTVQRPDGKCVTVYYFHHPDQPERFIGCTIWDPGK